MAIWYIANWGHDDHDGQSWETAKKTFQGVTDVASASDTLNLKGYYHERLPIDSLYLIGHSLPIIDGTLETHSRQAFYDRSGIHFINYNDVSCLYQLTNCIFEGCNFFYNYNNPMSGCLVFNCRTNSISGVGSGSRLSPRENVTIHNYTGAGCKWTTSGTFSRRNIYSNIHAGLLLYESLGITLISYSLFINTPFQFYGGGEGADEVTPTYPTGATDVDKLQNLRDRMVIVYGGIASDYLIGCQYYSGSYNDIFVDADNGNFNLVPFCIAAHMSYDGDYIGARREGVPATWNADWTSIVNIDSSGRVIDQNLDSSAESNIIDVGHIRSIVRLNQLGQRAARNGQQVNTETNLGSEITEGSSVLTANTNYMVVNNVIILDNGAVTTHEPFNTFYAVDEGAGVGLGFSGDGSVREVYTDARYESKIQIKASQTDVLLSVAPLITVFTNVYPVMVNVDGLGEPTAGNADASYIEGTAVPLYIRYIKYYVTIKGWNLPAR